MFKEILPFLLHSFLCFLFLAVESKQLIRSGNVEVPKVKEKG